MIESDPLNNEGNGLRIPCFMAGKQTSDFVIRGGDLKRVKSFVTTAISYLDIIPGLQGDVWYAAITLATKFAL